MECDNCNQKINIFCNLDDFDVFKCGNCRLTFAILTK